MKLIIAGATGYVGTELVRQSLRRPEITTVVALARRPTPVPTAALEEAGADAGKLQSVVVADYDQYPEAVQAALAGADACIWTVAVTPSKASAYAPDELRRICHDSPLAGLRAMHAGARKPFRFVYMSGIAAERDPTKTPSFRPAYALLRGETETAVLAYAAAQAGGAVEPVVVKPGLITSNRFVQDWLLAPLLGLAAGVPSIPLRVLAGVLLDQAVHGAAADTLLHADLVRLGRDAADR